MQNSFFTPAGIKDCIIDGLKDNREFLFNELELQMFVARTLEHRFNKGYKVHLEYRLPKGWNIKFDDDYSRWGEAPYFDVVLEDTEKSEFIVIELKYKLKEVKLNNQNNKNFKRFDTTLPNGAEIAIVTNQSAGNEARYDFWKDVKRLELLCEHFYAVKGGVALFVTNEENYAKTCNSCKYSMFGLDVKSPKGGFLYWNYAEKICGRSCNCGDEECKNVPCGEKSKNRKHESERWDDFTRPNFSLEGEYKGDWNNLNECLDQKFYCYSVLVPEPPCKFRQDEEPERMSEDFT